MAETAAAKKKREAAEQAAAEKLAAEQAAEQEAADKLAAEQEAADRLAAEKEAAEQQKINLICTSYHEDNDSEGNKVCYHKNDVIEGLSEEQTYQLVKRKKAVYAPVDQDE